MSQKYKCAICRRTYTKTWTDEEAMAEARSYFGNVQQMDCFTVCDDCYQTIHPAKFPNWTQAVRVRMRTNEDE